LRSRREHKTEQRENNEFKRTARSSSRVKGLFKKEHSGDREAVQESRGSSRRSIAVTERSSSRVKGSSRRSTAVTEKQFKSKGQFKKEHSGDREAVQVSRGSSRRSTAVTEKQFKGLGAVQEGA
jgi:hypothetical protein